MKTILKDFYILADENGKIIALLRNNVATHIAHQLTYPKGKFYESKVLYLLLPCGIAECFTANGIAINITGDAHTQGHRLYDFYEKILEDAEYILKQQDKSTNR